MKEKCLYCIWLCMYIVCVGMGTITQRSTALAVILGILAILFFVPGFLLLADGIRAEDRKQLFRVRLVSILSLSLTLCMILLNLFLVGAGEKVGKVLNDLLNMVSAPMFCSYWQSASLFLWACLFVGSFPGVWKK